MLEDLKGYQVGPRCRDCLPAYGEEENGLGWTTLRIHDSYSQDRLSPDEAISSRI